MGVGFAIVRKIPCTCSQQISIKLKLSHIGDARVHNGSMYIKVVLSDSKLFYFNLFFLNFEMEYSIVAWVGAWMANGTKKE